MKGSQLGMLAWLLLTGLLLAEPSLVDKEAPRQISMKTKHQWVLAYYMSYDNNLSSLKGGILEALKGGVGESDLIVTVLADDQQRTGLKRYAISAKGVEVETLPTDNSADIAVLASYMEWVRLEYPAEHYAIVFLNHGGRLDEMCLDEWPGPGLDKAWLSARSVGDLLREFRQKASGKIELLFLQQCGRGSIENLYNFRGTAASVMASQESVGAPNTYYSATLRWLSTATKNAGGVSLARQIMASDRHYSSYACVSGESLAEIPAKLEPVVSALLRAKASNPRLTAGLQPSFGISGESNFDLLEWLQAALEENSAPTGSLRDFEAWVRKDLVQALAVPRSRAQLSGLSIFVPDSSTSWKMYANYPIYQRSSLRNLWENLYGSSAEQSEQKPAKP